MPMFSSERLKGIDVFVCVAQAGSFKAAAEKMHLTGSAISKSIARLESRLGARLFERTTRRLALTDAGTAFYRTCTGVLADLEEAELALQAELSEPRGRVRIDLPGAFGRARVLPIILRWLEEHPGLIPHITFSEGFIEPFQEGVEVAVRIGGADIWPDTVGYRYLGREWHVLCAAPAYLARRGTPLTERDLDTHQCIAFGWVDGNVSPWSFAADPDGATQRRPVPARLVLGNGEALLMAAVAGNGIAQLPSWLIQQQLADGTLVEVLPHLASEGLPIHLAWIKSRQALPRVGALLQVLAAELTAQ